MTDQHKKHFFEHWITAYGNRLDEVAGHKKTNIKVTADSLKETSLSASPAISTETAAKTPLNRLQQ
ncbi:MAG TPA: hypothetical protein VHA33_23600 [Candidatus Angelobacter sp.]|nr:hypothetical protein [Candidatus Angelobacter sp.]